ncbi:MAG: DNA integrity scanning protein DisA nucleotide-binding domain protein [Planctomycetales bacterium]|nr:DNA integrity scanning protein DisA nucleotide-binding domain protein [Planctomycetales bacterium]
MRQQKFTEHFIAVLQLAQKMADDAEADAILVMLEGPTDWEQLKQRQTRAKIILAGDTPQHLEGAKEFGFDTVVLDVTDLPVYEKLTQALLDAVTDDVLLPGAGVVAVYSGFEAGKMDSISYIRLDEHLRRLTVRDLRQLETKVPLDTLKAVLDLAVEIGREGREGKPVGTMFVVGDSRRVVGYSKPTVWDPVKGYSRKERNLHESRNREAIKEIAQMDGAFIVSPDGTIESACRLISAPATSITLSKGLGTRHWAAASITKATNAIAIVVSESNGTVRLFQNGEVVLRIEPFRRAMKWKDFEYEPPQSPPSGGSAN